MIAASIHTALGGVKSLPTSAKLILATTFLASLSIFMAVPFISVFLVQSKVLTIEQVGVVIGVSFWVQRAGSLVGGLIADKFGTKSIMLLGLALRVPGYMTIGLAESFSVIALSSCLIGLGSSFYLPSAKSALAHIVSEEQRPAVLSLRSIFANLGVSIGPVIGMLVFTVSPTILFLAISLSFVLLVLININLQIPTVNSGQFTFLAGLSGLAMDKRVYILCLFSFSYYFCYIQLETIVPLGAKSILGDAGPTLLFVINSAIVILAQLPLVRFINNGKISYVLFIGFISIATAFFLLSLSRVSPLVFVLAIIIFSLGEIFLSLRIDLATTFISKTYIATCFGLSSLSAAFGGLLGSAVGTNIYSTLLGRGDPLKYWFWLAGIATIPALLSPILGRHVSGKGQ